MGGWMTYQRMRSRNNLMYRKPDDDPDPYWRADAPNDFAASILVGDLNRMERDYLNPVYPEPPWAGRAGRSDPSAQVADATGVDVEVVRKVLRCVFLELS
jgi:hypothetical protein